MGKSVYLIAFIATLAIFVVAIFSTWFLEEQRLSNINEGLRQIVLENELQNIYFLNKDADLNSYCLSMQSSLTSNIDELSLMEYRLSNYKESLFSTEYSSVKKSYLLTNLLLFEKVSSLEKDCNVNIKPVIYFYAEDKSCEIECAVLADELELVKRECSNIWVFALPYNWHLYPFTSFLEKRYAVTKPATLVVDGNKYESSFSKDELMKLVNCS